jgi:ABC-type amino acid transport substrate-binding protein
MDLRLEKNTSNQFSEGGRKCMNEKICNKILVTYKKCLQAFYEDFFINDVSRILGIRIIIGIALICTLVPRILLATELEDIRKNGVLRHLGIPYASFVMDKGTGVEGLDVELMQLFAKHLGVRYQHVMTSWPEVFGDLTGTTMLIKGNDATVSGVTQVKGDIIANGLTVLPVRQKMVEYSVPTFPTGVWLIARADSPLKPIKPTGELEKDIQQVKALLAGHTVLTMKDTCLDPDLYDLQTTGAVIRYSNSQFLGDIAPEVVSGAAEITLLDIPDALLALQKWPGEIKIIGPVSSQQFMAVAVSKTSPELLAEFNRFFKEIWQDGTYKRLVEKYYPSVFLYFDDFFNTNKELK